MLMYNQIDEINWFAQKGWCSGACFYEFYRKGGLNSMIELFNWIGRQADRFLKTDEMLRTHYMLFERISNHLHNFFVKYVIEDEKGGAGREARNN